MKLFDKWLGRQAREATTPAQPSAMASTDIPARIIADVRAANLT